MQTFNLTFLSSDELDKSVLKILELKRVSFQHVKKVSKQMDKNYPFLIPNGLLIIIAVIGTTVIVIRVGMIWSIEYCKSYRKGKIFSHLTQREE